MVRRQLLQWFGFSKGVHATEPAWRAACQWWLWNGGTFEPSRFLENPEGQRIHFSMTLDLLPLVICGLSHTIIQEKKVMLQQKASITSSPAKKMPRKSPEIITSNDVSTLEPLNQALLASRNVIITWLLLAQSDGWWLPNFEGLYRDSMASCSLYCMGTTADRMSGKSG